LAGNAWDKTAERFDAKYFPVSPRRNPTYPLPFIIAAPLLGTSLNQQVFPDGYPGLRGFAAFTGRIGFTFRPNRYPRA
jgi:hypothetical protein